MIDKSFLDKPVVGSAPIIVRGKTISLINDAGDTITEIDTGTLDNSATKLPTNKTVFDAIDDFNSTGLFEIDSYGNAMPIDGSLQKQFEADGNGDLQPIETVTVEDDYYELDTDYNIMPKEV